MLGLRPAPEFEAWLQRTGLVDEAGRPLAPAEGSRLLAAARELGG